MANKEITIPGLVAGKRYRMVVETKDGSNLIAPSIEFVVPPSPRLLSTYKPTYKNIKETYSYPDTREVDEAIPGTWVEVGAVQAAGSRSAAIAGWMRTKGSYTYDFYVNSPSGLTVGMTFTVSGMSSSPNPTYYDYLSYTVTGITPDSRRSGGNYRVTSSATNGRKLTGFTYNDGRALATGDTSNNGWMYYTVPAIPAQRYQNPSPGTHKVTESFINPNGVKYHAEISSPSDLVSSLADSETVKDIPIFFYIKNGIYYDMNDVALTDALNAVVDPTTKLPKSISNSSWKNPKVFTIRNNNAGSNAIATKDYRFTVARYTKIGTSWYGEWLQTADPSIPNPAFSSVISSQSAGAI